MTGQRRRRKRLLYSEGPTLQAFFAFRSDAGVASITIERLPGAPAVNGPGTLAVLTFTAIGSGQAPVTIEEVALKDAQSQPVAAGTATLGVQIK